MENTIKNTVCSASTISRVKSETSVLSLVLNSAFILSLSDIFSEAMEENVTPLQTLCALNTMCALVFLVFPVDAPILVRIIFFCWFFISLIQCKRAGMGKE